MSKKNTKVESKILDFFNIAITTKIKFTDTILVRRH